MINQKRTVKCRRLCAGGSLFTTSKRSTKKKVDDMVGLKRVMNIIIILEKGINNTTLKSTMES